jgi:vacuolar-type H+-ATPase subunit F/Vma7
MTSTQQLILRVTEALAQQIRAVVERHNDVAEQTPLIVEIEPENESGRYYDTNNNLHCLL